MTENTSVTETVSRLLERPVVDWREIGHGRNSRVSEVHCADGSTYMVKQYFGETADGRNRLDVEFGAFQWLVRHGETRVPRPIARDDASGIGIYEHIAGTRADTAHVTPEDVDQAVAFLLALDALRSEPGAQSIPRAAEACFSMPEILKNIRRRLDAFSSVDASAPLYADLHRFLSQRLVPQLERIADTGTRLLDSDPWLTDPIPEQERVLSPSDFGFHNAIRRPDGAMAFVDFEYFGWDDPAKTIADFLLHPAMTLPFEHKQRFASRLCSGLKRGPSLARRLPVAYALFGAKWCLILLNEFVVAHRARRRFAGDIRPEEELLRGQLAKVETMLDHVHDVFPRFPYHE